MPLYRLYSRLLSCALPLACLHVLAAADLSVPVSASAPAVGSGADDAFARRMAAEIIEHTAQSTPLFRGTLQDVARSLRAGHMSLAEARDILSLAASSRQLMGATVAHAGTATTSLDLQKVFVGTSPNPSVVPTQSISAKNVESVVAEYKPEELDIDALLIDRPARKKKRSLFKTQGTSTGYGGGLADEKMAWEDTTTAQPASSAVASSTVAPLNTAKNIFGRAQARDVRSSKNIGSVLNVLMGSDGQPQMVLIAGAHAQSLRKNQDILIQRNGTALVKAVVSKKSGTQDAFALIMADTWADGVTHTIQKDDIVQALR